MRGIESLGRGLVLAVLVLTALLPSPLGTAQAGEKEKDEPTALSTFRSEVAGLARAWQAVLRQTAPLRKRLEATRLACRRDERALRPTAKQLSWRVRWGATAADRMRLHNKIFPHFLKWTTPLQVLFDGHDTKPLTAQTLAQVSLVAADRVRAWVAVGEVSTLRGLLETAPGGIVRALALPGRPHPRRMLLTAVASRVAATPGEDDLDALRAVVSWDGLFAADRKPAAQLDLVSRDLVRVLTERKEDGQALGDGRYYVAGRFRDRGFAARFRDGSDQVRHFAWAFRMFTASEQPEGTAQLLRAREVLDARRRKQPLNKADVVLRGRSRSGRHDSRAEGRSRARRCA